MAVTQLTRAWRCSWVILALLTVAAASSQAAGKVVEGTRSRVGQRSPELPRRSPGEDLSPRETAPVERPPNSARDRIEPAPHPAEGAFSAAVTPDLIEAPYTDGGLTSMGGGITSAIDSARQSQEAWLQQENSRRLAQWQQSQRLAQQQQDQRRVAFERLRLAQLTWATDQFYLQHELTSTQLFKLHEFQESRDVAAVEKLGGLEDQMDETLVAFDEHLEARADLARSREALEQQYSAVRRVEERLGQMTSEIWSARRLDAAQRAALAELGSHASDLVVPLLTDLRQGPPPRENSSRSTRTLATDIDVTGEMGSAAERRVEDVLSRTLAETRKDLAPLEVSRTVDWQAVERGLRAGLVKGPVTKTTLGGFARGRAAAEWSEVRRSWLDARYLEPLE